MSNKKDAKLILVKVGDHLKPEFLKKNPFHKVPIIIDNGTTISESGAIMRYVATKYKVPKNWYPEDLEKNTRVLEYLFWHPTAIRKPEVDLFLDLVQSRIDKFFGSPKRPANADNVKSSKEALGKSVQNLADYFLKDKKFIAGDEISIADLACLCELVQLRGVNETACYESNPKVKAWAKRVEDSLKPHFEESLAIINDIAKQYGAGK